MERKERLRKKRKLSSVFISRFHINSSKANRYKRPPKKKSREMKKLRDLSSLVYRTGIISTTLWHREKSLFLGTQWSDHVFNGFVLRFRERRLLDYWLVSIVFMVSGLKPLRYCKRGS